VISAVDGTGIAYAATVITGVQPGNSLGNVPLTAALVPASITGTITSSTGSAAISVDLSVSALQPITVNSSTVLVTVPIAAQSLATATLFTAAGATCAANTDCASYTFAVPPANPSVGPFTAGPAQTPAAPAAGPVNYTIDAIAFASGAAPQLDCAPSNLQTSQTSMSTPLTAVSGISATAATLSFTGCN
jgi:hypothetical protein